MLSFLNVLGNSIVPIFMNLGFCYLKFYLFRFGEFLKNSVSDKDEEPMLDVKSEVFNECSSSF